MQCVVIYIYIYIYICNVQDLFDSTYSTTADTAHCNTCAYYSMASCCDIQQGSSAPPQMSSAGQQRSSLKSQPASCPRCHSAACCCCSQHTWAPGLATHCTSLLVAAVPAGLPQLGTPQPERAFPPARYSLQQLVTVMYVCVCVARPAVQRCSVCLPLLVYNLQNAVLEVSKEASGQAATDTWHVAVVTGVGSVASVQCSDGCRLLLLQEGRRPQARESLLVQSSFLQKHSSAVLILYFMNRKMAMIGDSALPSMCNSYMDHPLICTGVCNDAANPWTCTCC